MFRSQRTASTLLASILFIAGLVLTLSLTGLADRGDDKGQGRAAQSQQGAKGNQRGGRSGGQQGAPNAARQPRGGGGGQQGRPSAGRQSRGGGGGYQGSPNAARQPRNSTFGNQGRPNAARQSRNTTARNQSRPTAARQSRNAAAGRQGRTNAARQSRSATAGNQGRSSAARQSRSATASHQGRSSAARQSRSATAGHQGRSSAARQSRSATASHQARPNAAKQSRNTAARNQGRTTAVKRSRNTAVGNHGRPNAGNPGPRLARRGENLQGWGTRERVDPVYVNQWHRPRYAGGYYSYDGFGYRSGFSYGYWAFGHPRYSHYDSPFFFFGLLFIVGERCERVQQPAYSYYPASDYDYGSGYSDGYYLSRNRYSGLHAALNDIRNAWMTDDSDPMARHIDPGARLAVYQDGKYSYSMSGKDYRGMTSDAMHHTDTSTFAIYKVEKRSDGAYIAFGKQQFNDVDNNHKVAFVSYTIIPRHGKWMMTAVGSSSHRLS